VSRGRYSWTRPGPQRSLAAGGGNSDPPEADGFPGAIMATDPPPHSRTPAAKEPPASYRRLPGRGWTRRP